MSSATFTKDPDANLDYTWDWVDGLAAGKGVFVCRTTEELEAALQAAAAYGDRLVIEELERRATKGLRQPAAVLAAHVLGHVADLASIAHACERHGVQLIEDAAESLGASYAAGPLSGRQVGSVGRLGCFSFNGNKIMTTGGGGMIVTGDAKLAKRASSANISPPKATRSAMAIALSVTMPTLYESRSPRKANWRSLKRSSTSRARQSRTPSTGHLAQFASSSSRTARGPCRCACAMRRRA